MVRIGRETGLIWLGDFGGGFFGDSLWGCRFSLRPWCFHFSFFFPFIFVIGGSGVLSHGAVFGFCFLFLFYFLFFVDIETFSEH